MVDGVDFVVDDDVVVGGVLFVTSMLVLVTGGAEDEVLDAFVDDAVADGVADLGVSEAPLCGGLGTAAEVGVGKVADWLVPSVATCSSRTGGCSGSLDRLTPAPNRATTVAPRQAPTANRNGTPRWSSTVYFYWLNPIGSSGTKESTGSSQNLT